MLNAHDPGTKRVAAIPIEGLTWQILSKKELQLTTGKGHRVTIVMSLPPSLLVEHLEAKVIEVAALKAKAASIGVQHHRQWKSTHSVTAYPPPPGGKVPETEEEEEDEAREDEETEREILADSDKLAGEAPIMGDSTFLSTIGGVHRADPRSVGSGLLADELQQCLVSTHASCRCLWCIDRF